MTFRARWFAHANVNTADLATAEDVYCGVLGLHPIGRTAPSRPQDGAPYGLAGRGVHWKGSFLADERDVRGPIVDLLQWVNPPTAPRRPGAGVLPGITGLGFAVPDRDLVAAAMLGRGLPAQAVTVDRGGRVTEALVTADHDGTRLEVVSGDHSGPRYHRLRVTCGDLDRSLAFYSGAMHLECDEPWAYSVECAGAVLEHGRGAFAHLPGHRDRFRLELVEPLGPAGSVARGAEQVAVPDRTAPTPGNAAGAYRMAWMVGDVRCAHDDLVASGVPATGPLEAELGEGLRPVPVVFFADPDGTVVEYLEGVLA